MKYYIEWDAGYGKFYWTGSERDCAWSELSDKYAPPLVFDDYEEAARFLPRAMLSREAVKIVQL